MNTRLNIGLEAVVGCMGSGKSEWLLHRIKRLQLADIPVMAFKPSMDTRDGSFIVTRGGGRFPAKLVSSANEILGFDLSVNGSLVPTVVIIDEVQFFDAGILDVCARLMLERRVIVAGLDTDYRGRPFGPVPGLLAMAESLTKLKAVCALCKCLDATRTQLLANPVLDLNSPIFVGGDGQYEARCLRCHVVPSE